MLKGCINGLFEVLEIDKNYGLWVLFLNFYWDSYVVRVVRSGGRDGFGLLFEEDIKK